MKRTFHIFSLAVIFATLINLVGVSLPHAYATGVWQTVGAPGFSAGLALYLSLAVDHDTPYVAYRDDANDLKTTVMKFDGTDWVTVGAAGFSDDSVAYVSLALDNGIPYVAFSDWAKGNKATVMKFNGTSWETVGAAGFSTGTASYLSLALDNGTPYVAYRRDGFKATVMKFDGTNWVIVGGVGFSAGGASDLSLALDNGMPFVAYRDEAIGNKATVMKFDGRDWVNVGTAGFSAGGVNHPSLALDDGTPYVAYRDNGNGSRATVMKFDGTNWVTIGGAGFSAAEVNDTSLALDNGVPYLAYLDWAHNYKATVMKFSGTSWETVGTAGFSTGKVSDPSLALHNGTPFVAYGDAATGDKVTVMKFAQNSTPTDITLDNNTATENQLVGMLVGKLSTIDVDAGDAHTYSFTCSIPGADDASFRISGSQLQTNAVFDYETKNTYDICVRTDDGNGGLYDEAFIIHVIDEVENRAPTATDDRYSATMSTRLAGSSVLSNDTDADSDPLTASLVAGPTHASAFTFNADGTFAYTPVNGYQGTDTFTYIANDGTLDSNTATVTITITPHSKMFPSIGPYDGWMLESSETSNRGGKLFHDSGLRLGDHSSDGQDRALIHFTTASLPDNAILLKATLRIKRIDTRGRSPFLWGGNLLVDMKTGCFGSACKLQAIDFQAAATRNNIGVGNFTRSGGNWYQITLQPVALASVNRTGPTQFRLRFAVDDNDNNVSDYIHFYAGHTAQADNRPVLVVKYYVPLP